jgi:hypothetical protein
MMLGGALALLGLAAPAVEAQTAHYVGQPGVVQAAGTGNTFGSPIAVFVDSTETYAYVTDQTNQRVVRVAISGGAETNVNLKSSTGFCSDPQGVVADTSGNVYFTCADTTTIYKATYSGGSNGTYTVASWYSNVQSGRGPRGMAIDSSNNIYIAVQYNYQQGQSNQAYILKCSTTATCSTFYTFAVNTSSANIQPHALAVDSVGNLYISDIGTASAVYKLSSGTLSTITTGVSCFALAVDSNFNIYQATNSNYVTKWIYSGGTYPQHTTIITQPGLLFRSVGIALNPNGTTLYAADYTDGGQSLGNGVTAPSTASTNLISFASSGQGFGSVAVGSAASTTLTATFSFDTAGTLGSIAVLTQGVAGLDFTNALTGTCTANHAYSAGNTCTVNVTFTPTRAGLRSGAVELLNGSGTPLATASVFGMGTGPQVNFTSVAQKTVDSGVAGAEGLVSDAAGNLYIAAATALYKETCSGSPCTYARSTIATSVNGTNFSALQGLAIDGAGNLYLGDGANGRIIKETLSGGTFTPTVICSSGCGSNQVAVDLAGNVYFLSGATNALEKLTLQSSGSYSAATTIQADNNNPWGVAVDPSGNIFYTTANSTTASVLYKLTPAGSGYVRTALDSTLNEPTNIALDTLGNIYIAEANGATSAVVKETYSSGTTYSRSTLISTINQAVGVWVDASGNIFATSNGSGTLLEFPYATPPSLTFANTNELATTTSTTSGTNPVTLKNVGNAPLTFIVPSVGTNPSVATNFTLGSATCPTLSTGSSQASLAADNTTTCNYPITFAPTTGGSLSGSIVISDNNLNGAPATQSIALSGTGLYLPPTVTGVSPSVGPIAGGTTVTITGTYLSGATSVNFGGVAGAILTDANGTVTVTSPAASGVGLVDVTVTTPGGTSATSSADRFLYKSTPTLTWATPSAITYGTTLSATQLNATASVAGTFVYSPAAGSTPTAGTDTLSVTFTPTDTTDYNTATATVQLVVNQATPSVSWATPSAITYGTALSATQLNATSPVAGTFAYTPASGTVLAAGTQTLSVTFTPTDTTDYTSRTVTVPLTVNKAPTVTSLNVSSAGSTVATVASGTEVTLTATVLVGSLPVTSGTVNFCNASAAHCSDINRLGAAQLTSAGTATLNFYPGVGSYSYKAVYVGTASYITSSSSSQPLAVTGTSSGIPYATTTAISQSGSTGNYTLTATVTGNPSTAAPVTGTVSLLDTSNSNFNLGTAALGASTVGVNTTLSATLNGGFDASALVIGDFNGDGKLDLAVGSYAYGVAYVYLGNGDGTFTATAQGTVAIGNQTFGMVTADFNNDGKLDLASANNYDSAVSVELGNGDGSFGSLSNAGSVGNPRSLTVGDFNGDGNLDIAAASYNSNVVAVFVGNGDGTFTAASSSPATGTAPTGIVAGDFNGDGKKDLAVANSSSNNVTILLGNGDGTFTAAPVSPSTGSHPQGISVADVNADGKLDILVANYSDGTVTVLLGNGDGTFTAAPASAAGSGPYSIAAGDFNGDGVADLAVANYGSRNVTLLLGAGDGTFTATTGPSTDNGPQVVVTGDLNGDGHTDLATVNYGSRHAQAFLFNSLTESATATLSGVAPIGTGTHNVEFSYAGDSHYAASISATTGITAQPVTTSLALTANPGSSTYGQSVTLTATLSPYTAAGVSSNGETVTFYSGATSLGTGALSNGVATLSTTALTGGVDQLTAVYAGDSNLTTSTSSTLNFTVSKATPTVTWATPSAITYGTALSAAQLNATASVAGSLAYSPALGAVPAAGTDTLSVTFTPTDTTDYNTATATVSLVVNKATPTVTWATPSAIVYGTALSATQLNATASVPGSFVYSPASGAVPTAGTQTLSVTFTPTDTADYNTATATVSLVINKATPTVTWATPSSIVYGTALSATQLNATASVAGSFVYSPALGVVPTAGTDTLSVTFTPTDTSNYTTASATVQLVVGKATPVITWATPAAITYGTALSATQLNASASVAGSFVYSPALGSVPAFGTDTLTVSFTPTDTLNYTTASATVSLTVNRAPTSTSLNVSSAGSTVATVASGTEVTLTATVLAGSLPVTSGTVNFCNANAAHCSDINRLGTAQLTGAGTATLSFYPGVGSYSYKAVYVGTASEITSSSASQPLAVTGATVSIPYATTTAISQSGSTGNYSLTATVTGTPRLFTPLTGAVSFPDASNNSTVLGTATLGASAAGFTTQVSANPIGGGFAQPSGVLVGDFNNDGKLDLALNNLADGQLTFYTGNGDGTFTRTAYQQLGSQTYQMVAGDFNNDGKPDIASALCYGSGVSLVLGNGDGTFGSMQVTGTGSCAIVLVAGDFNGDGNLDIIDGNNTGNLKVLLGNGNGSFTTAPATVPIGTTPYGMAAGDFNGDGKLDFATANPSTNAVSVALGNGDGSFTIGATVAVGSQPEAIGVADFNEDGNPDIVVANAGDGTVSVLLGDGQGGFAAPLTVSVGSQPRSLSVADMDGDGHADIVVGNYNSSTFSVLLGSGTGTFTAIQPITSANPTVVQVGDLNGDSQPDIFAATAGTDNSTVLLLTGKTETATATANGISPVGTGTHNVAATYPGDSHYAASVSSTTPLTAQTLATTLTLATNPASSTYGQAVTLTASLAPYTAQGHSTNGQAIAFYNGSTLLGTVNLSSGSASLVVTTLPAGINGVTSAYSSDGNFASSNSSIVNYSVAQASKTITFPALTTPIAVNSTATLAATASNGDPVTYSITSGSAVINGSTITFNTAGSVTIAADSAFTANYAAAPTVSQTVVVSAAPAFVNLPTTPVGSTSATQAITVNIGAAGTLGSIAVLTQGASGMDFRSVVGGSCAVGTVYSVGQACTVLVSFSPLHPWVRSGGILLGSQSGTGMGKTLLTGTGTGPQVIFGSATAALTQVSSGLNQPQLGVAVDGYGNLYVADIGNQRIVKIPFSAGTYGAPVTLVSGVSPQGIVVDGVGAVYFADDNSNSIKKIPLVAGVYGAVTIVASGFTPVGLAVDYADNVYYSDAGNQAIKELPHIVGGYGSAITLASNIASTLGIAVDASKNIYFTNFSQSTVNQIPYNGSSYGTPVAVASSLSGPVAVTLDGAGNLYVAETNGNSLREIPYNGSSFGAPVLLASGFNRPQGVAVDAEGNVYVANTNSNTIKKLNLAAAPALTFPSTNDGTTSATQSVVVTNNGNAPLTPNSFTVSSAAFVSLTNGFTPTACPLTSSVAAGSSCSLNLAFAPVIPQNGVITGTATLTDNNLNDLGDTQTLSLSGTAVGLPAITGLSPAFGPAAGGTVVTITGSQFTGATAVSFGGAAATSVIVGSDNSITATAPAGSGTVDVVVTTAVGSSSTSAADRFLYQIAQTISFAPASPVTFGVSPITLTATGGASGNPVTFTLVSGPATLVGSTLTVTGAGTIVVSANQAGNLNYTAATTVTASIVVNQATPVITWATPAGITYGTALSATQLNATASVAGSFVYTPALGAVPTAGTDTLSVTFTPTDTSNYTSASATVQLVVGKATPVITWATPAGITYGTALSATQLNATASVAGSFVYTPALGAVPTAGTDALSVTFTPTDTSNYTTASATVQLVVGKATPVITWATPSPIVYGTALSATQLNATASVAGSFVYTPALGAVPAAGTDTLSVTFTPTDTSNYTTASATVQLVVGKATPVITWATPSPIVYGTALSATQLNATVSVAGSFVYTPALGAVPAAGTDTLSVTFTPTDTSNYTSASATVQLSVQDFGLSLASTSDATQKLVYGGSANFAFSVALDNSQAFVAPVTFTATGLPSGTIATFTPDTIPAGSTVNTVAMRIDFPVYRTELREGIRTRGLPLTALALLLLPLVAVRSRAHKFKRLLSMLLLLFGATTATLLSGCGGTDFAQKYTVTVTARSGPLSHSTTVTLILE